MGNSCVLRLGHVVFDEITFQREGFKADNDLNLEFSFNYRLPNDQAVKVCQKQRMFLTLVNGICTAYFQTGGVFFI